MTEGRTNEVPGYGYGASDTARSPLGMEDLDLLKQTVLFTGEDERYLRMAGGVLEDVVAATVYLASPAAAMVTGHTLLVDGGWTAW
jgi:NAD(P)-dependent dehydrogenase (short-subunit alcohol dehydrogenase family)